MNAAIQEVLRTTAQAILPLPARVPTGVTPQVADTYTDEDLRRLTREQIRSLTPAQKDRRIQIFADYNAAKMVEKQELAGYLRAAINNGVQFMHTGNATVAYYAEVPGGSDNGRPGRVVTIATALCHPNDRYSKSKGSGFAAKAFLTGKSIQLKMPKSFASSRDFVEEMMFVLDPFYTELQLDANAVD